VKKTILSASPSKLAQVAPAGTASMPAHTTETHSFSIKMRRPHGDMYLNNIIIYWSNPHFAHLRQASKLVPQLAEYMIEAAAAPNPSGSVEYTAMFNIMAA
jgi:hypothetical protein